MISRVNGGSETECGMITNTFGWRRALQNPSGEEKRMEVRRENLLQNVNCPWHEESCARAGMSLAWLTGSRRCLCGIFPREKGIVLLLILIQTIKLSCVMDLSKEITEDAHTEEAPKLRLKHLYLYKVQPGEN